MSSGSCFHEPRVDGGVHCVHEPAKFSLVGAASCRGDESEHEGLEKIGSLIGQQAVGAIARSGLSDESAKDVSNRCSVRAGKVLESRCTSVELDRGVDEQAAVPAGTRDGILKHCVEERVNAVDTRASRLENRSEHGHLVVVVVAQDGGEQLVLVSESAVQARGRWLLS